MIDFARLFRQWQKELPCACAKPKVLEIKRTGVFVGYLCGACGNTPTDQQVRAAKGNS